MGAICCTKDLRTFGNTIIFNLAISDILISGLVNSFTVVGNYEI